MRPITKEHNVETGEINERPMTDIEYEIYLQNEEQEKLLQEKEAIAAAKKAAAEAKLAALGLDADDLKALGLG